MKRRTIIIIIILFIIILLAVGGYFIFKSKPKTESDADLLAKQPILPPGPSGGGGVVVSTSIPAGFPIKQGMRGPLVADVQRYLASNSACINSFKLTGASIPAEDGVFGPITLKALKSCKGVSEVSKALYDSMMAPLVSTPATTSTAGAAALKKGDPIYGRIANILLFQYPASNSSISNINPSHNLSVPIGTFDSDSSEGFAKINVTASHMWDFGGSQGSGYTTMPHSVYVYKSMIKK